MIINFINFKPIYKLQFQDYVLKFKKIYISDYKNRKRIEFKNFTNPIEGQKKNNKCMENQNKGEKR